MYNAKNLEILIYFGQNFWVVTVVHKYTASLTTRHHLFLKLLLVETWFFADWRHHRAVTASEMYASQIYGEAKSCVSNCQRNTLQTLSVLKFHLLPIKVQWKDQPKHYINPTLSWRNILGNVFIIYVSHFLLTLMICNVHYVWIFCVLITLVQLT